jgi:hypothetical protein
MDATTDDQHIELSRLQRRQVASHDVYCRRA